MTDRSGAAHDLPFTTSGEWAAHLRWRGLLTEDEGITGWAQDWIGEPIDRLEANLFRTEGESFADKAVIAGMRQLSDISRRALPERSVLNRYRECGCGVHTLDDIRELPLDEIERALRSVGSGYRAGAGLGGAIAGALGALGVIAGVPPLLFTSLHAIHRLGMFHGHDPRKDLEEHFAVLVLATSLVSRPTLRTQVLQRLQAVARELESPAARSAYDLNSSKITENVAESLALQLVLGLMTRSWPVAGLVVGAGYSRAFVSRAVETARAAYGQRALLRRHGDAARVDPTH